MGSVALLDPKGAPHDSVQAIDRALRQMPGQRKLTSLIVPVFLQPDETPEDMFTSGSYRPLVKVLEGLRAHDEEAVELLAIPQEPQWQRRYAALRELVRDEEGPAEVLPGFTVHGIDVGKWLARQRKPEVWAGPGRRAARAPRGRRRCPARRGSGPSGAGRVRRSVHDARERLRKGRCGRPHGLYEGP
ncbi:hypothetical protein ACVW19_006759 [Streptomyces sp. TE5632]